MGYSPCFFEKFKMLITKKVLVGISFLHDIHVSPLDKIRGHF